MKADQPKYQHQLQSLLTSIINLLIRHTVVCVLLSFYDDAGWIGNIGLRSIKTPAGNFLLQHLLKAGFTLMSSHDP